MGDSEIGKQINRNPVTIAATCVHDGAYRLPHSVAITTTFGFYFDIRPIRVARGLDNLAGVDRGRPAAKGEGKSKSLGCSSKSAGLPRKTVWMSLSRWYPMLVWNCGLVGGTSEGISRPEIQPEDWALIHWAQKLYLSALRCSRYRA